MHEGTRRFARFCKEAKREYNNRFRVKDLRMLLSYRDKYFLPIVSSDLRVQMNSRIFVQGMGLK